MSAAGPVGRAPATPTPPAYFCDRVDEAATIRGRSPWSSRWPPSWEVLDNEHRQRVPPPHRGQPEREPGFESTWVLTSYLVSNAVVLPHQRLAFEQDRSQALLHVVRDPVHRFIVLVRHRADARLAHLLPRLAGVGGGGALGPSEQAILADTFPAAKRGMAMAVYGMAVVLAPAIGPTLGGFITDNFSWRWVFFINIPVGIASLLLSSRFVTDPPQPQAGPRAHRRSRLDGPRPHRDRARVRRGGPRQRPGARLVSLFVHHGVLAGCCRRSRFVRRLGVEPETRSIVDVRMFQRRSFAVANVLMLTLGIALFGSTVLLPQYLQVLMGYTAQQSGMALSPGGFVVILLLPFVGRMVSRVDTRYLVAIGFLVLSASLFYMARVVNIQMDLLHRRRAPDDPVGGSGLPVRPDPDDLVFGRASAEVQPGQRDHEPVAQPGEPTSGFRS